MIEEIPERPQGGGLGYPAIQTILSGMELLGMLMSGGEDKADAFNFFWVNYLQKDFPEYRLMGGLFYKNIRHSTAHLYLVRSSISLTKSNSNHLKVVSRSDGERFLNIDLKILFEDFAFCYEKIKGELKNSVNLQKFWPGFSRLFDEINKERKTIEPFLNNALSDAHFPAGSGVIVANPSSSVISYLNSDGNKGVSATIFPDL